MDDKPKSYTTLEAGRSLEPIPTVWLVETLKLLNEMAGEGISIEGCADPADLMTEIAGYLGVIDADDFGVAAVRKFQNG